ncbi:MAG: DUF4351 domain-containing protein [Microcystis sp. M04BS1]|uniref:DUF4351 domain-containing protein n=1 Tax=Microcystis aeruginosa Ma_MB_S_20031200_S102 TaxID=2486254 RepID=A0A552EK32_MICAE|nr:DUF4351 domain-containing protein [Microcystis sp. M04BS1]TRU25360.1 MAG: DUF4351 domain-containing protein [Microcystis aeruginosa Ma_MB_S_20031200_S102D]TRU34813.1 MAG: DUF4351 domain-containing protein [Microcystis aeruginosa Ma_MB_S_20031200_S102]
MKDYLETFLSSSGDVKTSLDVTAKTQEIDVYFRPTSPEMPRELGLLGRLAQTPCLLEPHRNPVTIDGIIACLSKLFTVREQLQREAHRNQQPLLAENIPRLWILTPTASQRIITAFSALNHPDWGEGIYFLPPALTTAIIVLHQLPETPETLWLRLLGRGGTRSRAIDELEALSPHHPFKSASLKLLYNLSRNLQALPKRTQEERKFIMRLAPLYEQDREKAIQQGEAIGIQKGEANLVLRLLKRRFGELPPHITETIQKLTVEKLEDLGEALLDFNIQADLINWLNQA